MMPTPSILVIIVTWNKKDYVLDLLNSLRNLDYPSTAIDTVVVDNASNDGTAEAIRTQFPQVNLICNPENIGGTGGFNTGLKWAFEQPEGKYKYLWLLDNDVLVHRAALSELVHLLETKPDVAVAGSTMMQLDYPWRINEMGAYVKLHSGELVLNRHLENIAAWQGKDVYELLKSDADLSKQLLHCQPFLDVDYVAAASLLIRADVAKQAGIWRDYFIHFDDVEWCLRIGKMGHRVLASAKSLIWHLSAAAKVPTWVLYYDNRNILDMMRTHNAGEAALKRTERYIRLKAVYYHLLGKTDLAGLLQQGLEDYQAGKFGKKDIKLTHNYQPNHNFHKVLANPNFKRIFVSYSVNLQATGVQEAFIQAMLKRPELEITFMAQPAGAEIYQLPRARFLRISSNRVKRWWHYWKLRGRFDAVIQSDYAPVIGLSWLDAAIVFINDEGFCERPAPQWSAVWQAGMRWVKSYF